MLGGGRRAFFPEGVPDVEYGDETGVRLDGKDLVEVSAFLIRRSDLKFFLA